MQWNANSLTAHKSELKHFLSKQLKVPDVICVQETFLNDNITNCILHGYTVEREDRVSGRGGGLATFIRTGVPYTRLPNPTLLEILVTRVKLQSGHVTIVNTYHAPNSGLQEDDYRKIFQTFDHDVIVLGDLNAYSALFGARTTDTRGRLIEELVDKFGMVVLNTGIGTYVRRTGELSHLDVTIATPNIAKVANWDVLNDTMGSDHFPVITTLRDAATFEETSTPKWSYRRADWNGYRTTCSVLMTPDVISDDVNGSRDRVVAAITEAAERNIPMTKSVYNKLKKSVPFWTNKCSEAVRERNRAKNKMQRSRDLKDRENYYRLRGVAQYVIKSAEKQYWRDYCSNLNRNSKTGEVWGAIRKMSGVRSRPEIPTIVDDDGAHESSQQKAELFAKNFAAYNSDKNLSDAFKKRRRETEGAMQQAAMSEIIQERESQPTEINRPFEIHELMEALRQSKRKSTPGEDRITYDLLKQLPHGCQNVLLNLYNTIWRKGQLPPDWKEAIICPLLKANKPAAAVTSYRPVALTSTLSKLMEKMVANRLRWWMEENGKFNRFQSGFRKQRSTIDHIMRLADDAYRGINSKQYTVAVMLDLEKAFDLVWHKGLLFKMEQLGLSGNIHQFVKEFLTDRSIRVRVGTAQSTSYRLENGTPQGSVISPLLFLIMINDVPEPKYDAKLSLYADDSATWKTGRYLPEVAHDVQHYLDRLVEFFDHWGFKISPEKTVAIVFTRNRHFRPDDVKLSINGVKIKVERTIKFLGITFDRELTWGPHIDNVKGRCNKRLNLLRMLAGTRWGASKRLLLIVYKALIRSIIDYASVAYDTAAQSVKNRLDVVQNKALRICCGAMTGTPAAALQVECGQPPLALRRLRMAADYALKIRSFADHPAASTLEDNWTSYCRTYEYGREPFSIKVGRVFHGANIDHVPLTPTSPAPWIQPMPQTYPVHLKPLQVQIKNYVTEIWQNRWENNSTGRFYYALQPEVNYQIRFQNQPRIRDVQLTRLRLGHVKLGKTLHNIGQRPDPFCQTCGHNLVEDIEHFLIHCPKQNLLQFQLKHILKISQDDFTIRNVLTNESCLNAIYIFLTGNRYAL